MKFFVLTKRKLLILAAMLIVCGVGVMVAACCCGKDSDAAEPETQQTAAVKRKIPIYSVETNEKKIAISFDAAWGNEQTEDLIKILDTYHVKTTFFVVGEWVDKYPESVKALHDAGHEVCNHSSTHPHMPQLSQNEQVAQLRDCNEKIAAITGEMPTLFRPPYGDYDNTVMTSAESLSMYTIQWDVDSLDWKDPTAQEIADRVTSKVQNGSIVLFHNGATNTPEALPMVLERLQAQGYEIVPISELILKDHYIVDGNGKQCAEQE